MKDVIVSFATKGRENYNGMLLRLIDSSIEHWKGDLLIYSLDHELSEYKGVTINKGYPQPKGLKSYTHAEMPYQFKTCMIQLALEKGYERIIWLDSSMQLKKDLTPLLDNSESGIVTFHNLGHPVYKYISEYAEHILIKENYLANDLPVLGMIPQIWGGAFMLAFNKPLADNFFHDLRRYSVNGSFKGGGSSRSGFIAHRHDQAVMSVLLNRYHHDMLPYGQILCPPHDITGEYGNDPYLICRGL